MNVYVEDYTAIFLHFIFMWKIWLKVEEFSDFEVVERFLKREMRSNPKEEG